RCGLEGLPAVPLAADDPRLPQHLHARSLRSLIESAVNHRHHSQDFEELLFRDCAVEPRVVRSGITVQTPESLDEVGEARLLVTLSLSAQRVDRQRRDPRLSQRKCCVNKAGPVARAASHSPDTVEDALCRFETGVEVISLQYFHRAVPKYLGMGLAP